MRWWLCCVLFLCFPCLGAESDPRKDALEFQKGLNEFAASPTGLYAIQDMIALQPGETGYLSFGPRRSDSRWKRERDERDLASVDYRDGKVSVIAPGVARGDLLKRKDAQLTLPGGLIVGATVRNDALKVWLFNPELPAMRKFDGLAFFPYDAAGVIEGTFRRRPVPIGVNHLDSRQHAGLMYWIGDIETSIAGKRYQLRAFNYEKDWRKIDHFLILLRDRTSGKTTYGGGRAMEVHFPKGAPPDAVTLNLNTLYSFLCAHSDFFNCPVNLTDYVNAPLACGEKYPPSMAGTSSGAVKHTGSR